MVPSEIPPGLPLAEELSPGQVHEYNTFEEANCSTKFREASLNLELLLSDPPVDSAAATDEAATKFEACLDGTITEKYKAELILACMPFFERRMQRRRSTRGVISTVHRSLGQIIIDLPFLKPDGAARGAFYETAAFIMGDRLKVGRYALQASLVREESSSARYENTNHDGYTIDNQGKIPLQIRGVGGHGEDRNFSDAIGKFYVRDVVQRTTRNHLQIFPEITAQDVALYRVRPEITALLLTRTRQLLYQESTGGPLVRAEMGFLNELSERLTKTVDYVARTKKRIIVPRSD